MKHVVIGGGIAGVCCVEELCRLAPADDEVVLISSSTVLKGVDSVVKITKTIEEVLVTEKALQSLRFPNLRVLQAAVTAIDTQQQVVSVVPGGAVRYDKLCICCGARPKVLGFEHDRVITLRDTQSVEDFASKLSSARRIAVVGNGGIALELIGAIRDIEVVWVLKHGHIGDAFFDVDAAEFLLGVLQHQQPAAQQQQQQQQLCQHQCSRTEQTAAAGAPGKQALGQQPGAAQQQASSSSSSYSKQDTAAAAAVEGHAAGPKWVNQLPQGRLPANVKLERNALVMQVSSTPLNTCPPATQEPSGPAAAAADDDGGAGPATPGTVSPTATAAAAAAAGAVCDIAGPAAASSAAAAGLDGPWPLYLQLSNGDEVGVDLLVQAIGVEASTKWLPGQLVRAPDGGILVNKDMETSLPGVFAAGDCCTVDPAQTAPHWFQMRLWSQARLMGCHAAACMAGVLGTEVLSFSFELFTHVTRFLGKKVVLLGLYNGQKLQQEPAEDMVMYTRTLDDGTPDATFVRVLLLRGKMQGAVLIGDTDLEETFENLILDGLDLTQFGPSLLDPDIELDHVFD